ncbi:o-succinylbenzoate--CoA ligase [Sanguibacter sp. 25GB23B1]|uniref:o-succinylbenzoate--CoA ligase n=1 Tax=unclassified Sanguibacter TaxID=2645534 RepID=UPI0032AF64E8
MIATPEGPRTTRELDLAGIGRHGPAELGAGLREILSAAPGEPGACVLVATSGSTGDARRVRIPAHALRASGEATAARLGGHGQWLLALPTDHVAGVQVVARSVLAGTRPVAVHLDHGFRSAAFAAAARELTGRRRYTSLVPTQLYRILEDAREGDDAGLVAARTLDAVLVGGAATSPALLLAARDAGVPVVTTYGMSETAGGCVYDGAPLDGVDVRVRDGRIEISGPVLADGYDGDDDATHAAFVTDAGRRWFRTSDVGDIATGPDGATTLHVRGRADDVLVSGGVNVSPAAVEALLTGWGPLREVCVVGVPDEAWGARVAAVVTLADGAPSENLLPQVRARVTDTLGAPAAPREIVVVGELPLRGPGKVDRRAATEIATRHVAASRPSTDAER